MGRGYCLVLDNLRGTPLHQELKLLYRKRNRRKGVMAVDRRGLQIVAAGEFGRFVATVEVKLVKDAADVVFDRLFAQKQMLGNLTIAGPHF